MKFFIFFYCLFLSPFNIIFSKTLSIENLLKKVDQFFQKNPEYEGDFEMNENNKISYGNFYFKQPNMIKIIFKNHTDFGKIILSNHKILWMYLPYEKLIIDQDIHFDSKLKNQLFNPFSSMKKLLIPGYYKFQNYQVTPVQKSPFKFKVYPVEIHTHTQNIGFKKIILLIQENGFIVSNKIIYEDLSEFSFLKMNIKFKEISNDIFLNKPILGATVIKNPFFFD